MSVKVRGGVRLVQDGRSARAQRPRRLMTVQFTRQIARDTSVDSPDRDGAEFDLDVLAASATAAEAQLSVALIR